MAAPASTPPTGAATPMDIDPPFQKLIAKINNIFTQFLTILSGILISIDLVETCLEKSKSDLLRDVTIIKNRLRDYLATSSKTKLPFLYYMKTIIYFNTSWNNMYMCYINLIDIIKPLVNTYTSGNLLKAFNYFKKKIDSIFKELELETNDILKKLRGYIKSINEKTIAQNNPRNRIVTVPNNFTHSTPLNRIHGSDGIYGKGLGRKVNEIKERQKLALGKIIYRYDVFGSSFLNVYEHIPELLSIVDDDTYRELYRVLCSLELLAAYISSVYSENFFSMEDLTSLLNIIVTNFKSVCSKCPSLYGLSPFSIVSPKKGGTLVTAIINLSRDRKYTNAQKLDILKCLINTDTVSLTPTDMRQINDLFQPELGIVNLITLITLFENSPKALDGLFDNFFEVVLFHLPCNISSLRTLVAFVNASSNIIGVKLDKSKVLEWINQVTINVMSQPAYSDKMYNLVGTCFKLIESNVIDMTDSFIRFPVGTYYYPNRSLNMTFIEFIIDILVINRSDRNIIKIYGILDEIYRQGFYRSIPVNVIYQRITYHNYSNEDSEKLINTITALASFGVPYGRDILTVCNPTKINEVIQGLKLNLYGASSGINLLDTTIEMPKLSLDVPGYKIVYHANKEFKRIVNNITEMLKQIATEVDMSIATIGDPTVMFIFMVRNLSDECINEVIKYFVISLLETGTYELLNLWKIWTSPIIRESYDFPELIGLTNFHAIVNNTRIKNSDSDMYNILTTFRRMPEFFKTVMYTIKNNHHEIMSHPRVREIEEEEKARYDKYMSARAPKRKAEDSASDEKESKRGRKK